MITEDTIKCFIAKLKTLPKKYIKMKSSYSTREAREMSLRQRNFLTLRKTKSYPRPDQLLPQPSIICQSLRQIRNVILTSSAYINMDLGDKVTANIYRALTKCQI